MKKPYTDKQGQYLAFIYYYGKIHGRPPSESEMQQYFRVYTAFGAPDDLVSRSSRSYRANTGPGSIHPSIIRISREQLPDLV
jgi:repressor LexA